MAQKKSKEELHIENRLKFFICSITFNGSDGLKLDNLNDLYDEKIIRQEEPCQDVDAGGRYSCEPSPFLVSACLMKKLKKEYDTTFENAPRPGCTQPVEMNLKRNNGRRKSKASPKAKPRALPASVARASKTVTVIGNSSRDVPIQVLTEPAVREGSGSSVPSILSEYLKVQQTHTKCERMSALKHLLLTSTAGQTKSTGLQEKEKTEPSLGLQRHQATVHQRGSTHPLVNTKTHSASHESNRSLQSISLPDLACPMASLPDFSCSIIEHAPLQELQNPFRDLPVATHGGISSTRMK